MGLFKFFKNLFVKKIELPLGNKDNLIYFCCLKNGLLKIGTKVTVPEGYALASVHYNKLCDIVESGDYVLDEVALPRLFKYCRNQLTRKGLITPTHVTADLYFVNKNLFTIPFKTPRFVALGQRGKIRISISGSANFKISDLRKFMQSFCGEYAIIRNKQVKKDFAFMIGDYVCRAFDKERFAVSKFIGLGDEITDTAQKSLEPMLKAYGVECFGLTINNIKVPKNYMNSGAFIKDGQLSQDSELIKMVEERLNNINATFDDVVYVDAGGSAKTADESGKTADDRVDLGGDTFVSSHDAGNHYEKADFFEEEKVSSTAEQDAPNIFTQEKEPEKQAKTNFCKYCGAKVDDDAEFCANCGKGIKSLVICPCCGAKNNSTAKVCMVCKSNL